MNTRTTTLMLTLLGAGAGCNEISGAKHIDFTRAPDAGMETPEGSSGSSGSGSGGDSDGGGGGSDGGDEPYDLSCGEGNVAVGIYGRSGAWIDNLGLICAPLQGDGSLGAPFMTSAVGGEGGSPHQASCPTSQALVGIDIVSKDNRVYAIDLLCQTISDWKMPGVGAISVPGLGNSADAKTRVFCEQGSVFHRVEGEIGGLPGYSGTYVHRAQFLCTTT